METGASYADRMVSHDSRADRSLGQDAKMTYLDVQLLGGASSAACISTWNGPSDVPSLAYTCLPSGNVKLDLSPTWKRFNVLGMRY